MSTWKWISQHSFWFFILFSFIFVVRTEWWLPSSLSEDPNFPLVTFFFFQLEELPLALFKKRVHCLVTNSFCLLITHVKMSLFYFWRIILLNLELQVYGFSFSSSLKMLVLCFLFLMNICSHAYCSSICLCYFFLAALRFFFFIFDFFFLIAFYFIFC